MSELKLCPFCGGETELVYSNDNHRQPHIQCKFGAFLTPKCPAHNTYGWSYRTEQEAIEAWNKRTGDNNNE